MTNERHEGPPALVGDEGETFTAVLDLIRASRLAAVRAVNTELIDLYGRIGAVLSQKVTTEGWGRSTVQRLSDWIQAREPGARGFSTSNLWRMRQFWEAYADAPDLAPLVRDLPWSHNLLILGGCKRPEERAFYLQAASQQAWSKRELQRQIRGALFERVATSKPSMSSALVQGHPLAASSFKDSYLLDFLSLGDGHREADLQRGLVQNLKSFLLELGRDFCFVGEQFNVQVGQQDFYIDLLFFHRGLQALVALELKIEAFHPSHLGQLEFYLEALDRDHRKPHEKPSIGLLLCKTRDADVVEYALSRSASPTLVAEYETKLPNKALLHEKLQEFYAHAILPDGEEPDS